MAVDALLIGRNALKNIGLLTAKKRVTFSQLAVMPLRYYVCPFCVAVMPFSQRLALFFGEHAHVTFPSSKLMSHCLACIASANYLCAACTMQFLTVSICDPLHGKEMQNKHKNNCKITKVPTAKLIEIVVANCKNCKNLEIVLCPKALLIFPD